MPRRNPLKTGGVYHVYNRGVEKRRIFRDLADYRRFLCALILYRAIRPPKSLSFFSRKDFQPRGLELLQHVDESQVLVQVLAFCLMRNHFHLLVQQEVEGGISLLMTKLLNSYTKYFNKRWERVGPLFQGRFKASAITLDEVLAHISRYIHLNPVVANYCERPGDYQWSTYRDYLGEDHYPWIKNTLVMSQFQLPEAYANFVTDHTSYAHSLAAVKHLIHE